MTRVFPMTRFYVEPIYVEPPSPRMKSVLDEHEKSTSENRSAFLGVGAEGVEPPTLCL